MEKPANLDQIIESDPLKKYGLKFMGAGAEKITFKTEGSDKKLIKVSIWSLRSKILQAIYRVKEGEVLKATSIGEDEKANVADYREQEKEISEVFGSEHVLENGLFKFTLPVTREIALAVLNDNEKRAMDHMKPDEVLEVRMLIETQPIAKELEDREKYKTMSLNASLIREDDFLESGDIADGLRRIDAIIGRKIDHDYLEWAQAGYIDVIRTVVERMIVFTKKTGLMVDIFGHDNVTIFVDEDGSNNFHLLDPVFPNTKEFWNCNIKNDKRLDLLRHYYTYYRTINYLVDKLDIDETLYPGDLVYFKGSGIPTEGKFPKRADI